MRDRFLVLSVALSLLGCVQAEQPPTPVTLRLLAFNDFHGNIQSMDPSPGRVAVVKDGKKEMADAGGAAYLASLVARERQGHDNNLLLSAGDLTGASPLLSALLKDEPTIRVMNRLGLDLNVVGNHEFDFGQDELRRKAAGGCKRPGDCVEGPFGGAEFTYLAANVVDAARGEPIFAPYVIRRFEGIDIAFIGVVTRETPFIVATTGVRGLTFLDEAETLNHYTAELTKRGVRAIVAILHEGAMPGPDTSVDGAPCSGLTGALNDIVVRADPAIDLFISGHTHQSYACRLNGRMVTQAGNHGRMLSVIDLTLDPRSGDITGETARNLPVTRDLAPDQAILSELASAEVATAPIRQQEVAILRAALSHKADAAGESVLGDVIADAQLAAAKDLGAIIAFTNPGGIRQDLPSDPTKGLSVNLGDLFAVQPFGNNLVVMDLTGDQLKLLLEQQWIDQPEDRKPRILQISAGFSYCYDDRRPEGDKILAKTMLLNGRLIAPNDNYRIVVNSFLAGGGDRFAVLTRGRRPVQGGGDLDALSAYIAAHAMTLPDQAAGRVCRKV